NVKRRYARAEHFGVFHQQRRRIGKRAVLEARFVEGVRAFSRPKLVLAQHAVLMQVKRRPARLGRWPISQISPFTGWRDEAADRRLVHNAGVYTLEPIIEPAQRFVLVLIHRTVEINSRTDHHFFWPAPFFPR